MSKRWRESKSFLPPRPGGAWIAFVWDSLETAKRIANENGLATAEIAIGSLSSTVEAVLVRWYENSVTQHRATTCSVRLSAASQGVSSSLQQLVFSKIETLRSDPARQVCVAMTMPVEETRTTRAKKNERNLRSMFCKGTQYHEAGMKRTPACPGISPCFW